MKNSILAFVMVLASVTSVFADDCKLTAKDVRTNLELSWNDFDQNLAGGHRVWGLKGCYIEEALLIDAYNLHNGLKIHPSHTRILYWHAGQVYAYANLNELAALRMEKAIDPNEPANPELNWNDYAYASIAFLRNDRKLLEHYRDRLAAGKPTDGNKMNLKMVDSLIRHFGEAYSAAYGH